MRLNGRNVSAIKLFREATDSANTCASAVEVISGPRKRSPMSVRSAEKISATVPSRSLVWLKVVKLRLLENNQDADRKARRRTQFLLYQRSQRLSASL